MVRLTYPLLILILAAIIIAVFVPFSPKMPTGGLDSSWALGLNQAVAQHLAFGKDIIFTLGPYSAIYTKAYHPATDGLMMAGSFYLAISFCLSVLLLMWLTHRKWVLLLVPVLFMLMYSRDSLLFSYPLLVGLITFQTLQSPRNFIKHSNTLLMLIIFLYFPLGLLVLIKGSLIILCCEVMGLGCVILWLDQQKRAALSCLLSPLISTMFFWLIAGQQLVNLPAFFVSTLSLAFSFTEAMAYPGNVNEIVWYLVGASFIVFLLCSQKLLTTRHKIFLIAVFGGFLFLSFKTGFTRQFGHEFIAGTSLLISAVFLASLLETTWSLLAVMFFSISIGIYLDEQHTHLSLANNLQSMIVSTWHGIKNRVENQFWLEQDYQLITDYLQKQSKFPILQGTTDIYSYAQSSLISSQAIWSPRPVFQSYSVFTPQLALKNKEHLLGTQAPENIIFKIEPIDERMPSLEDGISWPVLLGRYTPAFMLDEFLFLRKNTNPVLVEQVLATEKHLFKEVVTVPAFDTPMYAEIEIKPTLLGHLAIFLFKTSPLQITVVLNNGTQRTFRMVASMAKSGFLISPLIENTHEFALLFEPREKLNEKRVKSFSLSSVHHSWLWQNEYTLRFKS